MRIAPVLLVTAFAAPAFADEPSWHVAPSVAAGIEDLRYSEYSPMQDASGNQPVLDRNTGVTPTARVDVEVTSPSSRLFVRGSGSWTGGSTRYDGGVEDASTGAITPLSGPTSGDMTDFDLVVGARRWFGRHTMFGGFAGIGHHTWERDLRAIGNDTGYLEDYAWTYLQLGARLDVAPIERLHVGLEASLLLPRTGSLAITHQLNGLDDANLQLGFGLGTRVRLVAAYALAPRIAVFAIGGVETDNISSSSAAPLEMNGQQLTDSSGDPLYITEPYSKTTRLTATVGAGYAF